MNILKGKLSKRVMASFAGVEFQDLDKSLDPLADMGFISWEKIRGEYKFVLYSQPVTTRELRI